MTDEIREPETKLKDTSGLKQKIKRANAKAWDLRFQDISQSIALINEATALVDRDSELDAETQHELAAALLNLGRLFSQVGEYPNALKALEEALGLFEQSGSPREVMTTQAQIGCVYLYQASYVKALQHTLKGFEMAVAAADRELEAALLNNLGYIYIQRSDFTRALPYLLKAHQLGLESNNRLIQAGALERICCVYTGLLNPEAGLEAGRLSLQIYHEAGEWQGEAEALNSLGAAHQSMQDYASALECYNLAIQASSNIGLRSEMVRSHMSLGLLHCQQGQYEPAVEMLERALTEAREINAKGRIVEIHQALSSTYRQMQIYQKALFHYEHFHESKEQIFNDETEAKMRSLEVGYQVESARRDAEMEQQKNAVLQQEIGDRIIAQRALQSANEQLQTEIREREQLIGDLDAFARMVAHDLKTPLQNLALLTYLLERELSSYPEADTAKDLVGQIQQTGVKAASIINELLTLASLRSTDIVYKPLDMMDVIKEVLERLKMLIEEYSAQVELISEFPPALGYAPWLEEVMVNFIANGIKYGGIPPKIEIGADPAVDGRIRFWVKDNGEGISPKDQAKLFHDFSRLSTKQLAGHGLGLSISRRIITKLGGDVGVESSGRAGDGAVFWFTLPVAVEEKQA